MAKTALVTGATSGIGESLCLLFASDGYDLVTVARDEESLKKQAEELRALDVDVLPVACDLSDPNSARTIFKRVKEAGKEIEILVNDAGYSPAGRFSELSVADIRAMLQVSVTSLAELTNVFLQPMLERGHGRILNMSSMMAKTPCPYNALYGAAKVFVLSFSTALAHELRGSGVTVTTVCPGATRTNFPKNAGIEGAPAWKYFSMSADETAIRVYRALMRGELCAVTGWYNKVGAFGVRFMPMGFQLMAGEWLMGTRTHPLDHEGTEEGAGQRGEGADGKGQSGQSQSEGRKDGDQRGGKADARKDDKGSSAPHYQREHPLGRDGQRGWYDGGREARVSPWVFAARKVSGIPAIIRHERSARVAPWEGRPQRVQQPAGAQPMGSTPPRENRAGDPCGGGVGWRANTLGCKIYREEGGRGQQQNQGQSQGQAQGQRQKQEQSQSKPQAQSQSQSQGQQQHVPSNMPHSEADKPNTNMPKPQPGPGKYAGPTRDGEPADLGRFTQRGSRH
ncbi:MULTISPECIES: SDR family NAD(P)-dependent oxidoreductase [Gordonibacter]|uniref:SDR family oxidoreductase n=1 Tax=Gordonibacter faecis TaxID=3047475 RepID=A0ABT7DJN7_9ACTN|nr:MULTISPECIES: SDR family oxidoreductase [unclassified Gordonibacter]MDJ1649733.1 SDR family oxidoreductase [Gordonibacter sp. KGMB12511]HIW76536.1 SDR family oxidoreductase [Candidatus Gordonibacter avicola]